MVMTFITRGLQSKKLAQLEQQLSSNLKATQNRIWTGVTKDVGYLRRLLNELYILKVKPVYTDADFAYTLPRSASCPELSMYRIDPAPIPSRKRAYSICADLAAAEAARGDGITPMVHASSDTELSKFDRTKTFETAEAYRQTTDLLAKVVNALATVKPSPPEADDAALYGGYHGFSDSQILASEWSFSTMNEFSEPPRHPRARACSDFNIGAPRWRGQRPLRVPHNEWTWSGDNEQIQEAFNNRYKSQQNGLDPYVVHMEEHEPEDHMKKAVGTRVKKFSMPDGLRRLFHRKRPSQDVERKLSVVSVPEGSAALPQRQSLDYYSSTVTAGSNPANFRNGLHGLHGPPPPFASNASLPSTTGGGITNHGFQQDETEQSIFNTGTHTSAYQRKSALGTTAAAAGKRRRESIYTQNPVPSARRGSMYPPTAAALAQMQRRGSLATTSGSAAMATAAARRGSLFPATAAPRRSSIFSVTSEKDMDVLEQTTIADLIRALEVVHTHAVLDEQQQAAAAPLPTKSSKADRKQRKMGNAGLDLPTVPGMLSLFAGDQTRTLQAAAANRLYSRRSTIIGTMSAGNVAGRRPSGMQMIEPPPSYTEKPQPPLNAITAPATSTSSTGVSSKFRRRFSVRPTALQIPPGQAPPPGDTLNEDLGALGLSQTSLQRRISLRPSPLAREASPPSPTTALDEASTALTTSVPPLADMPKSSTRLLPSGVGAAGMRPSTSSTHSPLSRIVQISQAQRKSSKPEAFGAVRKLPGSGGTGTGAAGSADK
ncbi:open rectifier potassium channel protein 1 isoform X2 [Scaptodrosophila lebanonensis]|nr:open rectifier potassium channel protein 1 isoform X2 [Scaptodrosophila lebanonensis]